MSDIVWKELSKPEISNFGVKIPVEKYVASLDISMDDMGLDFLVEKCKTNGCFQTNNSSSWPVKENTLAFRTCKWPRLDLYLSKAKKFIHTRDAKCTLSFILILFWLEICSFVVIKIFNRPCTKD